ncbi:conserved hypothetical protein [Trichinella spiralis]|uniref:hypothetical protein n=1 Tax=Trichinella spiralis TaxID=6334 RepID=UPI0001EFE144|nr:conserved hypothetical protein [Trichinella spiralis]
MSFTTAILILISLKTCMAQVATCKDDGDRDVDCISTGYAAAHHGITNITK